MSEIERDGTGSPTVPVVDWRLKLGGAMFALSILAPLALLPQVPGMELTSATAAAVSGAILVAAETLGIAAIAVMGKSGYAYLKSRLGGILRQHGPPRAVSRTRYRIGLMLFVIPIAFGWATPYLAEVFPALISSGFTLALTGDAMLVISLFVLGGDFWDKVRALFVHEARASFP